MRRRAAVGFIVGLPLLGIATAEGLKAEQHYEHLSMTRSSEGFGELCAAPGPEFSEVCETRSHLNVLEAGSLAAGLLGVALLAAIRGAGFQAQTRRSVYLRWARSGPGWVVFGVLVVASLQAAVVIAAVWYTGRALFGDHLVGITIALAVVAVVWIVAMGRSLASIIQAPRTSVIGTRLEREQGLHMYQRVEQLAQDLGALPPRQIVVGLEAGFFTTDAAVTCVDDTEVGRTLYCALPLIRIVSLPEFDALVGHELRHPRMERERARASSRSLALLPALPILDYVDEAFAIADRNHARERELAADRDAARVAGPVDVASAFVKAFAMTELLARIQRAAPTKFEKGQSPQNISKAAAELAVAKGSVRPVGSTDSAISLIEGVDSLEEKLSACYEFPLRKSQDRRQRRLSSRTA